MAVRETATDAMYRWRPSIRQGRLRVAWEKISPPQLLVLSFAGLILLGTLGFRILPGLYTGEPLGWVDALFTATSAACITGLIVVDTATYFTPAGQAWILLIIQLGGLGLLTLTSAVILRIGRRLSLRHEELVHGTSVVAPTIDYRRLVRSVLVLTFSLEAIGALLLWAAWVPEFGWRGAVWPAVFHSISAFCNAGFSLFTDSLIGYRDSPMVLTVVMVLVVLGGLGFLTLTELATVMRPGRRHRQGFRVSLFTRLVLVASAVAVVLGWGMFALFEWHNTLADLPVGLRVLNALFGSTTPRSGGFSTVDYSQITDPTAFFTILLMMAGGAPGSTAGGLKITTVALIGGLALARLRGEQHLSAWGRSIPTETVQRAVGYAVTSFTIVTAAIFVLIALEAPPLPHARGGGAFLRQMFESVSAFATVGLSMGVTSELSAGSRVLAVVLMFVGRVGLLTVVAAVALRRTEPRGFRYAYEDVPIG